MLLEFTKMHGLGNDFVVINNLQNETALTPDILRYLADRHTGVGCDQILELQVTRNASADVMFRFYNADGSEAGQCGNGARCLGKFMVDNGLIDKNVIRADTIKGQLEVYVQDSDTISVNMGPPQFEPESIPLLAKKRQDLYDVHLDGETLKLFCLSMGNPHAVLIVDDVTTARVDKIGQKLQNNPIFPESVNVGFMQILDRDRIKLRVYERGAGETLACGSGACAAVVAGILDDRLDNEVVVCLKKGKLVIKWQGEGMDVWMTGPATTVYDGKIEL